MNLFTFIDCHYGSDGDAKLERMLKEVQDINETFGPDSETALHVAARRHRLSAIKLLLTHGAEIDAENEHGKTAYVHALRRGFHEIADFLKAHGANTKLNQADQFACAVTCGNFAEAEQLLKEHPGIIRTGNPEEDRLLADLAGRGDSEPVKFLIVKGADLEARGLDDGTPLHQAAWFGQPGNVRLLVEAGAPLEIFDSVHTSSPLGWAVHGSRYSDDSEARRHHYIEIVHMLLESGAKLNYPGESENSTGYFNRLTEDAPDEIKEILIKARS